MNYGRLNNGRFTARQLVVEPLESRHLLAGANPFELSGLLPESGGDASEGFVVHGAAAGAQLGRSASLIGDVNGDGLDDVAIGAPSGTFLTQPPERGNVYVVFGSARIHSASLDVTSLDGTNGFIIRGGELGDVFGHSVGSAGDVNGDGLTDILIGAPHGTSPVLTNYGPHGVAYVVFGQNSFPAVIDVDSLDGGNGFAIQGLQPGDLFGVSVSSAGDLNGDGLDDLLIGSSGYNQLLGAAFVIFGHAEPFESVLHLSQLGVSKLDGSLGFEIPGTHIQMKLGSPVSSAGDFNGDGLDDILLGAPSTRRQPWDPEPLPGAVHIVLGQREPFSEQLHYSARLYVTHPGGDGRLGSSVAPAGDLNGDGFDDVIVGEMMGSPDDQRWRAGTAYVIFGRPILDDGDRFIAVNELDGSDGFAIHGVSAGDLTSSAVALAGDVNGDGYNDLLVAAPSASPADKLRAGTTYLLFGRAGEHPASVELAALDGSNGFALLGTSASDGAGTAVTTAGDFNGDGFDDFLIGAPFVTPSRRLTSAGQAYVVYGRDFLGTANHLGTERSDVLIAEGVRDVLIGGLGDDTLLSTGGPDVLRGGPGDDVLAISDTEFSRVQGGHGVDVLRFAGSSSVLDLRPIAGKSMSSVEVLDMRNSVDSRLKLDVRTVYNLSDTNRLTVLIDEVGQLEIGPGWTYRETRIAGGEPMDVFVQGNAELSVSHLVHTEDTPPRISSISDQRTDEDTTLGPLPFTIGDDQTLADFLQVSIASSNTDLFGAESMVMQGSGNSRGLLLQPARDDFGTAVITLTVSDGTFSATDSFTVNVLPVNDPPVVAEISDQRNRTFVDVAIQDAETPTRSLSVAVASSNPELLPTQSIRYELETDRLTLEMTPIVGGSGTAAITVDVTDGHHTTSRSFNLLVEPAPVSIDEIADQFVRTFAARVPLEIVYYAGLDPSRVDVSVTSSNPAVVPADGLVLGGGGQRRNLMIIPAPDVRGRSTITVTVHDGTSMSARTFDVLVSPDGIHAFGQLADHRPSIVYNAGNGELMLDLPAGTQLSSLTIESRSGMFSSVPPPGVGRLFSDYSEHRVIRSDASGIGTSSLGRILRPNLLEDQLLFDFVVSAIDVRGGEVDDFDLVFGSFRPAQPGDANQDGYFGPRDIIRVLTAGKYMTGEPATWDEGDWDGGPGGIMGYVPSVGDGIFDHRDIIAALNWGCYNCAIEY